MTNDEYEFPEYAPNWGQSEDEEYWWSPTMERQHSLDYVVDKKEGILWRHVVRGMRNLCKSTKTDGPFNSSQISKAIYYAVIEDTIDQMVKDGLVEIVNGDMVKLTEKGKNLAQHLKDFGND